MNTYYACVRLLYKYRNCTITSRRLCERQPEFWAYLLEDSGYGSHEIADVRAAMESLDHLIKLRRPKNEEVYIPSYDYEVEERSIVDIMREEEMMDNVEPESYA